MWQQCVREIGTFEEALLDVAIRDARSGRKIFALIAATTRVSGSRRQRWSGRGGRRSWQEGLLPPVWGRTRVRNWGPRLKSLAFVQLTQADRSNVIRYACCEADWQRLDAFGRQRLMELLVRAQVCIGLPAFWSLLQLSVFATQRRGSSLRPTPGTEGLN